MIALAIIFALGSVMWLYRWRTSAERWTTRERSHGHPFYWLMRYTGWGKRYHHRLYNRPHHKAAYNVKNIIYIE